ncbi:hypothetical protein TrVFT333_009079 [Trichoderma virens FT-333]|nr:hypothetical protein TrVFT333_009079 [Trichoderma virens FT-333]
MAAKALKDLQFIQQPRPQRDNRSKRRMEWDRIARAVENMFGFLPDEQGADPAFPWMRKILDVYENMNEALQGNHDVDGFNNNLGKPLWMCGDESWAWYDKDDMDPNDPGHPLSVSKSAEIGKNPGAWIYRNRYFAGLPGSVGICRPSMFGITMPAYDLIIFCHFAMDGPDANLGSIVDWKNNMVEKETHLDGFGEFGLSRIMIHEFTHWFGAEKIGDRIERHIDQQAVSEDGRLLWWFYDAHLGKYQMTTDKTNDNDAKVVVYGYTHCSNLARVPLDNEFAQNSGPHKAIETAESYAYFAMMAYLDDFDWSSDGKAKRKE